MAADLMDPWKDHVLLAAEWAARQVYWRIPRLRAWVQRRGRHSRPAPQAADRGELKNYLRQIGIVEGALVMAHTSVAGLQLPSRATVDQNPAAPIAVAGQLLQDLLDLVGDSGTLAMPTHAIYQSENASSRNGDPPVYNPATTGCSVGLANELFRRRRDVRRSLFPYNMLAARGPLADELLRDNLNDAKPLPHGIHSGYYRFCQLDGLVVSIGVPLARSMTLIHTAEELRDRQWPVSDFFEDREYIVVVDGERKKVIVRQTRQKYLMFSMCVQKLFRDLVRTGILHEGCVGTVRVDWARSKEVLDFIMARNEHSTYPYYLPELLRWSGRRGA